MKCNSSFLPHAIFTSSLYLILIIFLLPSASMSQPCPNVPGGCPGGFGADQGAVFEFNESFLTEAIRNAWDANGLGSPRGEFFLEDPTTSEDDDLEGYVIAEPLAIKWDIDEGGDYRRLRWVDRDAVLWDDLGNSDENWSPEHNRDNWDCNGASHCPDEYRYFPLADDRNDTSSLLPIASGSPQGGFHTVAAESCPAGFFDGLSPEERTEVQMLSDTELAALLEALPGWPTPSEVNDPETGIGPDAYTLLMKFAKELERAPHNEYNRYTFFHPGPNWLRILSPIVVIKNAEEPDGDPRMELRFPLFGVYNPLGCARWYYQYPTEDRTFSNDDIKVSWAVLVIRAGLNLNMSADPSVLEIIMDSSDESAVEFLEGNLNEDLEDQIRSLPVDPDWLDEGRDRDEWYDAMAELMARRQQNFFEHLTSLVELGIGILNIHNLLTIPLDPLMENYENLRAGAEELGISFTSMGLIENPLETMQFKMWEIQTEAGSHEDGICAIGMDFLDSVDPLDWEVAEYNFISDGKQYALSISNYLLNAVLPALADDYDIPELPLSDEDRCGNHNWIDYLKITNLDLEVPIGSGDGIPQITGLDAEIGFNLEWWVWLCLSLLVVAAIGAVIATLGMNPWAWAFLALVLTMLASAIDLEINHFHIYSRYTDDGSTFRFIITHENSLPQLGVEVDGTFHAEEKFAILTTIVNPVASILVSTFPAWFEIAVDDPVPVENLFFTGFRFSLRQADTQISDWLQGLATDYAENNCSGGNLIPECNNIREQWRTNEDYRKQVTFLKANYLEHFRNEMIVEGQFCLPPDFYDLEEVIQSCDSNNQPTATLIDNCANFYDPTYVDEDSCEDFVAICNNCTAALSTEDDTEGRRTDPLTVSEEERDETIGAIIDLLEIVLDCDSVEMDFFANIIIQRILLISNDDYKTAQSILRCRSYSSYTPPSDCQPNEKYEERMDMLDEVHNQSSHDDGLSEDSEGKLVSLAEEVRDDVLARGDGEEDFGLVERLKEIIDVIKKTEECPDTEPSYLPPREEGDLWDHPWSDPDLDGDGYSRFGPGEVDCDDFDATVHPGATEVCNRKDDNCDGKIDEGFDEDGDGVTICADPPDCDDGNPYISPDADEICENLVDDDCDGVVDEEDCVGCTDEDEDGFSPIGGLCGQVDCDDTDPDIYPGAPETAGDGIDSNCNGYDDCFIATAAFGSPLDDRIDVLRRFRDQVLLPNPIGHHLVTGYYKVSPPIAEFIKKHETLRRITRWSLIPVITFASLAIK